MTGRFSGFFLGGVILGLFGNLTTEAPVRAQEYRSPAALAYDASAGLLYIAEATARRVACYDPAGASIRRSIPLPEHPTGLALAPDGRRLFVTTAGPEGNLHIIDTSDGTVLFSLATGHTPCAPVIAPGGGTLLLCNRFSNTVSIVDLESRSVRAHIPVTREPVAAALSPDGRFLFVANHLPAGAAVADHVSAVVDVIDVAEEARLAPIVLPDGSTGLRGLTISPDGRFAYVTHTLARYKVPTSQIDRGWINTNALSIIDVYRREHVNTVLLDEVDRGAANPWDVACTADGRLLCVALAGAHELAVLDREELHARLDRAGRRVPLSDVTSAPEDVSIDLSFLTGARRRIPLPGRGPRGLVVDGTRVFVAEYFSDTIALLDLQPNDAIRPRSLALGPTPEPAPERLGEMLFNDATICFQGWQSCASCHPDVRTDALNWDLLNDGLGNTKQAKSLLLAHETPPAMITGVRPSAEVAVRAGMRYILFAEFTEDQANAIDAFLRSLRPVPSPYLMQGSLSPAAERGRLLFQSTGCAHCHSGPYYTNRQQYDMGMGTNLDSGQAFDVPTLIECWRTGPYLYDGRAATLQDMLTTHNAADRHGHTTHLSERELKDLIAFVLSL